MKISCCVFDLDGTLLTSENRISDLDLKTLRDRAKRGVKIVIATGRSVLQIKEYVAELGISDPVITCNGGVIVNPSKGEVIYESFLSQTDAKTIIDTLDAEGEDYLFYTPDFIYHASGSERINFYKNYNKQAKEEFQVPIRERSEYPGKASFSDIHKILVMTENRNIPLLEEKFNKLGSLTIVSSGKGLVDIMPAGTTKGGALLKLSEYFNIPVSEIVAFGDSPNDESMLKSAGFSVAMGNAKSSIREIADFVTKSNDEFGITYAIEYIEAI